MVCYENRVFGHKAVSFAAEVQISVLFCILFQRNGSRTYETEGYDLTCNSRKAAD